jgi:rubrerythrin
MSRATAFVFLRALDVFEAGVDQRVLADFHEPRADPHNRHQEPMGLLQLRAKLNANAYTKEANWWRDVKSIFGQFGDDPPDSARRRMAGALSSLFNLQWRILMFGRLRCYVMWLARQQREVKDLKAAYIADQEARAAAASRTSPSSARALAAGATSASMVPMIKQPAAVAPLFDGPVVPIAAAAASSASRPAVVAPRGAGDEQAEREKNAAHLLAASVMASSPTSSPPAAAAIAASLSPSPVVPAPASVGASAAAAAAAASSSDAQNHEDANSVSLTGRLRRLFAALIDQAEQLERDKGHLTQDKQQFIERTAELATAESHIADAVGWAERIVSLKQTRAAGGAVAPSPAQLVLAGKRKAEAELESEAKRRRHVEGKLAELTEQMDDNDKCIVCLDKQPDVLFLRCKHLVCCNGCAETIMRGAAAGASCPTCRKPLRAKDVVKVFRA